MSVESLRKPLRSLFPAEVITAVAAPEVGAHTRLYPEEEAVIAHAVSKRRREFAAGRICARRALARLGILDYPLMPGPDRVPIWPAGVVGSISHTDGLCCVAVARATAATGIGLDIESAEGLDGQYWSLVLGDSERRWLDRFSADTRDRLAKLIFSAKECTFKCQYCVYRQWLEFSDVQVVLDLDRGEFTAKFLKDLGPDCNRGSCLCGHFAYVGWASPTKGWVLTGSLFAFAETAGRPAIDD